MLSVVDLLFRRNTQGGYNVYNGHFQLELEYIEIDNFYSLLLDIFNYEKNNHKLGIELFIEDQNNNKHFSLTLSLLNFWKEGEHSSGHTDQQFLNIDKIIMDDFETEKIELFNFFAQNTDKFLIELNC